MREPEPIIPKSSAPTTAVAINKKMSRASQGLPEKIDDQAILAAVVALLGAGNTIKFAAGTAKERVVRGALVPSSGPPPSSGEDTSSPSVELQGNSASAQKESP